MSKELAIHRSKRLLANALVQFTFLILISIMVTGVASAQEKENCVRFLPGPVSGINLNHSSVGQINRAKNGLNSNIVLFRGSLNQQDINRSHISVGDIN